jgi:GNAT superfamily N-acetyltransferase
VANKEEFEQRRGEFLISTDKSKLDIETIHKFLAQSYWSPNIPREIVARAIENSFCFGIYSGISSSGTPYREKQIGFARVISDFATYAYLADVFVLEEFRGQGLSKWLMQCIMEHPALQGFRRFTLATKDAHGLYAQFGFKPLQSPDRYMERFDPDVYQKMKQ